MTTLDQFRPGAPQAPATKAEAKKRPDWEPPDLATLSFGQLLCFDPSLSATGFVALVHDQSGMVVTDARTMKGTAPDGFTGWEAAMSQVEDLEDQFTALATRYNRYEWEIAIEQPPMGGGKIAAPESALLVCKTVRSVFRRLGFLLLPMVSPQSHKRTTVNRPNAKKAEHHKLLRPMLEALPLGGLDKITNEAKRDAISVGITALRRRTR